MEFPLFYRELRRLARMRSMFLLRLAPCGLVLAVFAWWELFGGYLPNTPDRIGQTLAEFAFILQFGAAVLMPPILAARLIAGEKEEGTIDLLLLANVGHRDMVLAKWTSVWITSQVLVIATLPVLAFSIYMGGVHIDEVVAKGVLFSFASAAACAVGILCSAYFRRTGSALVAGLFLILGTMYVEIYVPAWLDLGYAAYGQPLHPGLAALSASADSLAWRELGKAAVISLCIAGAGLLLSSHLMARISRAANEIGTRVTIRRRRKIRPWFSGDKSGQWMLLYHAPVGISGAISWNWAWGAAAVGLAVIAAPLSIAGAFALAALAIYDLTSSLMDTDRRGIWDDVLVSVTDLDAFSKDLLSVQYRRALFYLPFFLFVGPFGVNIYLIFIGLAVLDELTATWQLIPFLLTAALLVVLAFAQLRHLVALCSETAIKTGGTRARVLGAIGFYALTMLYVVFLLGATVYGSLYLVQEMWSRSIVFSLEFFLPVIAASVVTAIYVWGAFITRKRFNRKLKQRAGARL